MAVPGAILLSPCCASCVCAPAAALLLPSRTALSAPSGPPCFLGLSDLNRQASLLHEAKRGQQQSSAASVTGQAVLVAHDMAVNHQPLRTWDTTSTTSGRQDALRL